MGLLDDHMKADAAVRQRDALWSDWFRRYRVRSNLAPVSEAANWNAHCIDVLYEVDERMGEPFLEVLDEFIEHLTLDSGTPGYAIETPDGFRALEIPEPDSSAPGSYGAVMVQLRMDGAEPVRLIWVGTPEGVEPKRTWKLVFADDGGCFLAVKRALGRGATPYAEYLEGEVDADLFARAVSAYLSR